MAGRLAAMGKRQYQDVVGGGLAYGPNAGWTGKTALVESALDAPLHWRKPKRIFVCSMGDLFHPSVPDKWIRLVHALMSVCGQHTFQLLTKRPERAAQWYAEPANSLSACQAEWVVRFPEPNLTPTGRDRIRNTRAINGTHRGLGDGNYWPLPNVWLGTSCENQAAADERIPHLLRCPAAVRFLSCEPLLGPVDLSPWLTVGPREIELRDISDGGCVIRRNPHGGFGWVIVGGESGPKARPCDIAWIRSIRDQCTAAGVACFVKQLGAIPYMDNRPWLRMTMFCGEKSGKPYMVALRDPKGGDPAEWPADLRNVRQWPVVAEGGK
jgi:protein gp37